MSTGKRLAKRSIIGTRVCAPGGDQLWYCGVIQKVKTPPTVRDSNCITLTADTKYTVRFDIGQTMLGMKEYLGSQLIGPGFQNVMSVMLSPGQRVFITYNGRESAAEVLTHDIGKDEVCVRIPANGLEVSWIFAFFFFFYLILFLCFYTLRHCIATHSTSSLPIKISFSRRVSFSSLNAKRKKKKNAANVRCVGKTIQTVMSRKREYTLRRASRDTHNSCFLLLIRVCFLCTITPHWYCHPITYVHVR